MQRNVLGTEVLPTHYNVTLTLDMENRKFGGVCTIDGVVHVETDTVVLNALDMTFTSVRVVQGDVSHTVEGKDVHLDEELERATVKLGSKLTKGAVQLQYDYVGNLSDRMKGFYAATFKTTTDGKEEQHVMATTQFEPADCRRALPCWDEPVHKATFDITLVVPENLTALSNTHVIKTEAHPATKTKTVTYATTPVMSTYLLAFIVGELEYLEKVVKKVNSGKDTVLRVYTTPGRKSKGQFSLEVAEKCLEVYERYFEVDYPLEKCDLVAIPDFECGAMENWGLITYRETTLLCDASSSFRSRLTVALVVAHELAHQWFGNLVTMEWWKELWLNESFATFIEFDTVAQLFPTWKPWAQFIGEDYQEALDSDSLLSSHPVEVDVAVSRTEEIDEIFDGISYAKGCSLMRMLHAWIGPDHFRTALASYIKKFSYKNATTVDLWDAFEESSKMPVRQVMGMWISEQGYPILKARRVEGGVEITQNRFLSARPPTAEEDKQVWAIPLAVATDKGSEKVLLDKRTQVVPIPEGAEWVNLNCGQFAVVRVHYDDTLLQQITKAVNAGALEPVDVAGIVNNLTAASRAALLPAANILQFVSSCVAPQDITVWSSIGSALSSVDSILRGSDDRKLLSQLTVKIHKSLAADLGWVHAADDDGRRKQLRGLALTTLALEGDEAVLKEAKSRFEKYIASGDEADLPSDLRGGMYSALVKADTGRQVWDVLRKRFEDHDDPSEQVRCLRALGKTRNPDLLKETLAYIFSGKVRTQNIASGCYSLAGNTCGTELMVQHVMDNWGALYKKYGGFLMMSLVGTLECCYTEGDAERIEAWWASVDEAERKCAEASVKMSLEAVRLEADFKKRYQEGVIQWLKNSL